MDFKLWGFSIALLAMCLNCAGEKDEAPEVALDDLVVAQVGDKTITAKQLRKFSNTLPKRHQAKETGLERHKDHLQTMIDMELLKMEAQNENIAQSPRFLRKISKAQKIKLSTTYQKRNIKVVIKESEIREYVEKEGLSRALRFRDIQVASKTKAEALLKEIKGGGNFAQVAEKWSLNRDTATKGGDIGQYLIKDQMIPSLQNPLFSLALGEISEPIKIDSLYSIFKVIDEKTIDLNPQQRMKIEQDFGKIKFGLEKAALVKKLKIKCNLEINRKGLEVFIEKVRQGASFTTEDERNIILYQYDKGRISAGNLVDVAMGLKGEVLAGLTDGEQVASFADRYVIPDIMLTEAAVAAGMDKQKEIVTWLKNQRGQLVLAELRNKVLEGKIDLSVEAVRQHYDSQPKKYLHPEQLDIQEILVETEAEARHLVEKIQEDVPMGDLARRHSIRPVQDQFGEDGIFHFHEYEIPHFGGLVEAAFAAPLGDLQGPIKVKDGYSIFKVLSRERKKETFVEAEWRVRRDLKNIRSLEVFNQYLGKLRNKYESHVTIREDDLKTAFEII